MKGKENNLFKYATKELSQDAFICWCINFINYQGATKEIGKKMLRIFLPKEIESDIDLDNAKVEIRKQFLKIDILLIINKKYFIIVEDKIDSYEHTVSNTNEKQLKVYKEKLIEALEKAEVKSRFEIDGFDENNIYIVYLKTGEQTEKDKDVDADVKLNARDILKVIDECSLREYGNISYILKEYREYSQEKKYLLQRKK
ncbi:MAG: PD-(D/E)XK nuclease family protein [Clostridia bacterium]|nr:PD-(D/E)XK nuclease family protein [Clostridia bacterium]